MIRHFSMLFIAFALACTSALARNDADTLRVLFIGNSYTYVNNLPELVTNIAAAADGSAQHVVSHRSFTPGGCTLQRHLTNEDLIKSLKHDKWDYVVVQEYSTYPAKSSRTVLENTYPYAKQICELAKQGNDNCKVIFYMTWGHENGSIEPTPGYTLADNYEGMQQRLISSYLEMAHENNAWCAPVGLAWQQVRHAHPEIGLYSKDHSHPSINGSYLAAIVIYSTILQQEFNSDFTSTLDPEVARYLQQLAQRTVLDNRILLNLK